MFLLVVTLAAVITHYLDDPVFGWILAAMLGVSAIAMGLSRLLRPVTATVSALADGLDSLTDNDFSVSIADARSDDLGRLISAQNRLGGALRVERQTLFQRELLLDTVIQSTDIALLLVNDSDRVVYSNTAARTLANAGKPVNGLKFDRLLEILPGAFAEAVASGRDGLFTLEESEPQTYHLSQNAFTLNAQPHRLYLFKHLTQELSREEVATWKKVIRVISHELNNSLAPISSLAHSGKKLLAKSVPDEQIVRVFNAVEDRARHLKTFIERYAKFARLPAPRKEAVEWSAFLQGLADTIPFTLSGSLPSTPVMLDATQFEQVMINLIKNAQETGCTAEQILVSCRTTGNGFQIEICDSGGGMPEEIMQNALLPFYSTKSTGSGLGLPLCREIIEGHGGRLALANSATGLRVIITLPAR